MFLFQIINKSRKLVIHDPLVLLINMYIFLYILKCYEVHVLPTALVREVIPLLSSSCSRVIIRKWVNCFKFCLREYNWVRTFNFSTINSIVAVNAQHALAMPAICTAQIYLCMNRIYSDWLKIDEMQFY